MADSITVLSAPPAKDQRAGIFWLVTTMFMFVSMDTCAKFLVADYPTMQVVWARYFFQVLILAVVLAPRLPTLIKTQSLKFQLVRSLFLLGATLTFFTGLETVQVAEASAIMFTAPLILTALAPFVLKEKVGPRRWASVAIGFIGAMIIIRPGVGGIGVGGLWVLAASTSYACYQLSTRALSQQDPVLTTLFYSAVLGAVIMSGIAPFDFKAPDLAGWSIMFLTGALGTVGHFCMIKAFTHAEASKVAPYTYTNIVWATLIGFTLFGKIPDFWTYVGAGIIVASGLYIMHRERTLKS